MEEKVDRGLIRGIEEFSAIPSIALNTMGLLNNPAITIKEIINQIKLDVALVAFILKNCNSFLFGLKQEVKSIEQAVSLLGFLRLKSILMSYFARNLYKMSGASEIKNILWKHSVAVAAFSQVIAPFFKISEDESYLCGLLHDIGKLVLLDFNEYGFKSIYEDNFNPYSIIIEKEKEFFGTSHTFVGFTLLDNWKFPKIFIDVVYLHHNYQDFKDLGYLQCVILANLMVYKYLDGIDLDLSKHLKGINIKEEQLDDIFQKGLENFNALKTVL